MELQQIKYFRVIAQTGNITKAAEQLYVAQPSLSQMLKRIEDEVGVPLFDRTGKKITLNGAGRIFLKHCDEICRSIENAQRELDEYKGKTMSDVSIAVESASLLIPSIIEKIRDNHPQIMPHIYQSGCDDWDLRIWSDLSGSSDGTVLLEEPIGVVMPKVHPLAGNNSITRQELSDYSFISLGQRSNLYKIIAHFCEKAEYTPHISMFVDSPAIMRDLLKMDLGIAFVPKHTWHSFYSGALVFKYVSDMPMTRYVHLSVNKQKYQTDSVKRCRDTIAEYFEQYSQKFR